MSITDIIDLEYIYSLFTSDLNRIKLISIILLLVGAFIFWRACKFALRRVFERAAASSLSNTQKVRTVGAVLVSVVRYTVIFFTIVIILNILGVKTGALLAGAGVAGLAIGLGARNLVEDVLAGLFILFENQFAVGEFITAMNVSGEVEAIGMRMTKLRDPSGVVHYLPNGKIVMVTNHSRGSVQVTIDVQVAYSADHNRSTKVLEDACQILNREHPDLMEKGPEVKGLAAVFPDHVLIRISGTVARSNKSKAEILLRKHAKEALDSAAIKPVDE